MNQGRVWCVVNPSVGLPLLLGSVAITSLIVHASVMTHTTWMSSYWSGSWRNKTVSSNETPPAQVGDATRAAPGYSVTVTPLPGVPGKSESAFVVSVTASPVEAAAIPTSGTPGPLASAAPAL
jgi:light-harvesting protein B-800-850 alpha chain